MFCFKCNIFTIILYTYLKIKQNKQKKWCCNPSGMLSVAVDLLPTNELSRRLSINIFLSKRKQQRTSFELVS